MNGLGGKRLLWLIKKQNHENSKCFRSQEIHKPLASLLALVAKNVAHSLCPSSPSSYILIMFMLHADNTSFHSGPLLDDPIPKLKICLKPKQNKRARWSEILIEFNMRFFKIRMHTVVIKKHRTLWTFLCHDDDDDDDDDD